MIELAQHIEVLLLENDCVIVPGFGGFIAHYAPAMRVAEENLFLPPTRTIGFNPQLTLNDGVLVQSYMAVYDTNFSDATKMVEKRWQNLSPLCMRMEKLIFLILEKSAIPFIILTSLFLTTIKLPLLTSMGSTRLR